MQPGGGQDVGIVAGGRDADVQPMAAMANASKGMMSREGRIGGL